MIAGLEQVTSAVTWALSALLLSAAIIFCVGVVIIGGPVEGPARVDVSAQQLEPIVGQASLSEGQLEFSRFEQSDGRYHGIVTWRAQVRAQDYPVVVVDFESPNSAIDINLTWKRADRPGEVFSTQFSRGGVGAPAILMSEEADWRGTITELGLYAVGTVPAPFAVRSLSLEPGGGVSTLRALVSEWTAFRGWSLSSINYLRYFPGEQGVSPLPYVGLWLVLSLLLLLVAARLFGGSRPAAGAYVLVIVIPWLLIDLLWQRELYAQLEITREKFQGKTVYEKHRADEDAWIYKQVMRIKQDVLPQESTRIVIAHASRGHKYERLKIHYYLLPHNIYNFGNKPPRAALRQGDYMLVMRDTQDPSFVPKSQRLAWKSGMQVVAQQVDTSPLGNLYKLVDPTLEPPIDG